MPNGGERQRGRRIRLPRPTASCSKVHLCSLQLPRLCRPLGELAPLLDELLEAPTVMSKAEDVKPPGVDGRSWEKPCAQVGGAMTVS